MTPKLALALAPVVLLVPLTASAQDVLIVGAPLNELGYLGLDESILLRDILASTGEFAYVQTWDARASTPTVEDMEDYHAVLLYSEIDVSSPQPSFADPVLLGDRLAEYVELGHGVVVVGGALQVGSEIQGEFVSKGYLPVTVGIQDDGGPGLFVDQNPGYEWLQGPVEGHFSVYGVNDLFGGTDETFDWYLSRYAAGLSIRPDAEVTASWSDGTPAIIVREPGDPALGRTVAVNIHHLPALVDLCCDPFPPTDPHCACGVPDWPAEGWIGDGDRAMSSSLLWAIKYEKPFSTLENTEIYQDLDCDGFDVGAELPVDPDNALCAARIDPETGAPYPQDDWYFDYQSHTCEQWLGQDDVDGDGLVGYISPFVTVTDPICASPLEGGQGACDGDGDGLCIVGQDLDGDGFCLSPGESTAGPGDPFDPWMVNGTRPVGQPTVVSPDGIVVATSTLECDNCPTVYNPEQYDIDSDEVGDLCDNCEYTANDDQANQCSPFCPDCDAIGDACDNCGCTYNPEQYDTDNDGVGDACDNCVVQHNADQLDSDACPTMPPSPDGIGDACDNCPRDCNYDQGDVDFDGVGDVCDNCPQAPNPDKLDSDKDGLGDVCDPCPFDPEVRDNAPDTDLDDKGVEVGDGVGDSCDNCPAVPNPDQIDTDQDGIGDACDSCPINFDGGDDGDEDGFGDACDVCPAILDPEQADRDGDKVGDACDGCPDVYDAGFQDSDNDGITDVCDKCLLTPAFPNADLDDDGVGDACDNCPEDPNPYQEDEDFDGIGDVCDRYAIRGGGASADGGGCAVAPVGAGWLALGVAAIALRRRSRG